MSTMDVVTFRPPQGCRGEDGPAFQGNFRKGELRGIIHINKDNCVGCDTCRKFCPVDGISGGLGAIHKIRDDACLSCGQCLSACPFGAIEQMSFVDDVIAALKDPKKFVVAHPSPAVSLASFLPQAQSYCPGKCRSLVCEAKFSHLPKISFIPIFLKINID